LKKKESAAYTRQCGDKNKTRTALERGKLPLQEFQNEQWTLKQSFSFKTEESDHWKLTLIETLFQVTKGGLIDKCDSLAF
jgi:hypothetical protein